MSRHLLPSTLLFSLVLGACDPGGEPDGDDIPSKADAAAAGGGKADGFDWCEAYDWYGDGVCDGFCMQPDPDCGENACTPDEDVGPGELATDTRRPEVGDDVRVLFDSRIYMSQGLAKSESKYGPTIEAKFELDDAGALSLSVYPAGKSLAFDAERNVFQELAGDPTRRKWSPTLSAFTDQEHLTRSARDLTLVQLGSQRLVDVVWDFEADGMVYWAIPTIEEGRAGFGVYWASGDCSTEYAFVDGGGSKQGGVLELGRGPGAKATDARVPELGDDLSVLTSAKITMAEGLALAEERFGDLIEAKFELDGAGKLSLSIYPVSETIAVDAQRQHFFEAAGDPTVLPFAPELVEFAVPDVEHLTRSARDLTLVQTASMTLRQAVDIAAARWQGGIVYWAIPTIRGTRSGYGIYVYEPAKDASHYLFVS